MKIASWNVNSLNVRLPHLQQWLQDFAPDVVGLQETKLEDHKFPEDALLAAGLSQRVRRAEDLQRRGDPRASIDQRRAGGHPGLRRRADARDRGDRRTTCASSISTWSTARTSAPTSTPTSCAGWTPCTHGWPTNCSGIRSWWCWAISTSPRTTATCTTRWSGTTTTSSPRSPSATRCARLLGLGLHDGFRLHHDDAGIFSWWDYRQAAFRRDLGLRIDLTLVSDALKPDVVAAGIDRTPRTWERASDHTPAWVELAVG